MIRAIDRTGLLRDITQILTNEKINIRQAASRSNANDHTVTIRLTLEVIDTDQLSRTLEKINQLPRVLESKRKD